MPVNFLIKQMSTGKCLHINSDSTNPDNCSTIALYDDIHERMHWTFEKVEDHWGYIKQVCSGKVLHPRGGERLTIPDNTELIIHSVRHYGALFAMDQAKDHIVHKGGTYVHLKDEGLFTDNGTLATLHSGTHDGMRFQFVSVDDPEKEILVYGSPVVLGTWKIINMVRNPLAEHKSIFQVKIGKSKTESTTSSFQYKWDMSVGINIRIFSASASLSVQNMIEKSSSDTWSEETTSTREIKVSPGSTVVTWQYVFHVNHDASKRVFQSNLLADTDSETVTPEDVYAHS